MQDYFDNAATSFPKPRVVLNAINAYQEQCGASPGRGGYAQTIEATDVLDRCRSMLCELVHAPCGSHCVFTLNCTDALNLAINGIASHHRLLQRPMHIVTTAMDHNSVLRPLDALHRYGVTHTIVEADPETGLVEPARIADAMHADTRLVAVVHGSNVTGSVQDIEAIGALCGDIPFLVDAAQTMGHTPIDMQSMGIDLLAFPGHKGLLGPLGTGGLILRQPVVDILEPLRFGGTGSESEETSQPIYPPDKYESGSHNMVGIVGLEASVTWILSKGVWTLHNHEMQLCEQFLEEMKQIPEVRISGPQTAANRCGVFSLVFEESPDCISRLLEQDASIKCRAGLHCAPLAHKTMGTDQHGGSVRVSFGPFHSPQDVSLLVHAITQCAHPARV